MDWGAIIGVVGTLLGVTTAAVIEAARQGRARDDAKAIRAEERRVSAHEQMLAASAAALSVLAQSIGLALKDGLDDESARAALGTAPDPAVEIRALLIAQARVRLHAPEMEGLCSQAVKAVLEVGATAGRFERGEVGIDALRTAVDTVNQRWDAYADAATADATR